MERDFTSGKGSRPGCSFKPQMVDDKICMNRVCKSYKWRNHLFHRSYCIDTITTLIEPWFGI